MGLAQGVDRAPVSALLAEADAAIGGLARSLAWTALLELGALAGLTQRQGSELTSELMLAWHRAGQPPVWDHATAWHQARLSAVRQARQDELDLVRWGSDAG
jgi:hypothetical protein